MTAVYVDTSALLAFIDRDDMDHEPVTEAVGRLVREGVPLLTSSYVLVECGALVKRRLGPDAFAALGSAAARSLDVVWVGEALHGRAWAGASKESCRGPSLVDWTGFLVMEDMGLTTALALDPHFRARGFQTLP
jgi:predicted nucleic acid-binding protein